MEGEHDLEDAQDRYEKRWMMKENERKAKVGAAALGRRGLRPELRSARDGVAFQLPMLGQPYSRPISLVADDVWMLGFERSVCSTFVPVLVALSRSKKGGFRRRKADVAACTVCGDLRLLVGKCSVTCRSWNQPFERVGRRGENAPDGSIS